MSATTFILYGFVCYMIGATVMALLTWATEPERRARSDRNRRHDAEMKAFIRDYYDRQDDGR